MRTLTPLLLVLLVGCGSAAGSAFNASYPDNDANAVADVIARLAAHTHAAERPVAVGVTSATPREVFAVDLTNGQLLFRKAVTPVATPMIAGNAVLLETADDVVALSLEDGHELFKEPTMASTGRVHLVGAGGEGDSLVFALGAGDGGGTGRIFVHERGARVFTRDVPHAVGAPTISAGLVFVPWAYQNVSVLDAVTGDERARVRVTDTMVGHVFTLGDHVYVGQRGLFRFTPAIVSGTSRTSAHYAPPETGLPQAPELMRDAYVQPPAVASATNRVRFVVRPSGEGDSVTLSDGALYLVFYRMIFALDATTGAPRWYAEASGDIAGSTAREGGLVVMDAAGVITTYDTSGIPVARHETGIATDVATLRADGYEPARDENAVALSLREQLVAAVRSTDARLVPARRFALRALAGIADDEVTADLMGLCEDRRLPPMVKEDACTALARRPTGPAPILAGLARRASFLDGTTAPEVAPLARAAGSMHEARAVPLLITQLAEPTTTADGVAAIADALKAIGDASAAEPLLAFLRMYHADIQDFEMVGSLKRVADAYAALSGERAGPVLAEIAADAMCEPGLAAHLSLLARNASGAAATTRTTTATTTPAPTEELPTHVTVQMVATALEPVHRAMTACLEDDASHPRSARITVVIERDGSVRQVSVTPASLEPCIEPYVHTRRFPATRGRGSQPVTFTFRLED